MHAIQQSSCDRSYDLHPCLYIFSLCFCSFDIFPGERFSKLWKAKSYPSEKLSPKPHFLLRHFLTFSIIARIIYALMCQTCYIRYHKIYSPKFKIGKGNLSSSCWNMVIWGDIFQIYSPTMDRLGLGQSCDLSLCSGVGESPNKNVCNFRYFPPKQIGYRGSQVNAIIDGFPNEFSLSKLVTAYDFYLWR